MCCGASVQGKTFLSFLACIHCSAQYGSGVTRVFEPPATNTDPYLLDGDCVIMKNPTGEGSSENEKAN